MTNFQQKNVFYLEYYFLCGFYVYSQFQQRTLKISRKKQQRYL